MSPNNLEAGYGDAPAIVADTVARAVAAGAVGFHLEDQVIGGAGLYLIEDQSRCLLAARQEADGMAVPVFINARTDLFLKAAPTNHDDSLVEEAVRRARAYADAGASGIFVPGLVNEMPIERVCRASPLPVNIMVIPTAPSAKRLAELGVARISHGPGPYRVAMRALEGPARSVYQT